MNLKEILPSLLFGQKELKDAPLKLYDDVKFTDNVKKEVSIIDSRLTLNIEPTASINSYIVNGIDDLDSDELEEFYLEPSTLTSLLQNQVVVLHVISGRLTGNAGIPVKDILNFELGLNKNIGLKWYKPYDKNLTVSEAITGDLMEYKTLLTNSAESNFWETRAVNEAFSFSYNGKLDLDISVNLASVIGVAFGPVFSLAKSGTKIPLEIDSALSIGLDISKDDVFECLVNKISEKDYQLKFTKKKITTKALSLSGEISVSLFESDQDKITKIIDNYFEKYLGKPIQKIDAQIEKYDALDEDDFISELIEKIDFLGNTIEQLKQHFSDYKAKIAEAKEKVIKLVCETVKLGMNYEYKKVVKKNVFLDVVLSNEMLKENFRNILKLDIRSILKEARIGTKGVDVQEYFAEKSISFERSFSIGISLGNWALRSSSEEIYKLDERYHDVQNKRSVSIAYFYSLETVVGKEKMSYNVSMNSESNVPDDDISYDEQNNSLTLIASKYDHKVRKNDKKDVNRLFTTAVSWGGMDAGQISEYSRDVWDRIYKDEDVKYECKLTIPVDVFEEVLNTVSKYISLESIADAMAVAILPDKKIKNSNQVDARLSFYPDVILKRFKGKGTELALREKYYEKNFKKWALREIDKATYTVKNDSPYLGSENIVKAYGIALKLISAVKVLDDYIQRGKPLENHQDRKSKTALNLFFEQLKSISRDNRGFSQRWFGQLIIAALQKNRPELLSEIVRTFSITYKEDSKEKTMVIST